MQKKNNLIEEKPESSSWTIIKGKINFQEHKTKIGEDTLVSSKPNAKNTKRAIQ